MRPPRLKTKDRPMFYHLYNRVAGEHGNRLFGNTEKEKFIRLLHKLQAFFTIEIIAYQVMDNHFHLIVYAPPNPPTLDEAKQRYQAYYGAKGETPSDERLAQISERMADISCLMHAIQQQFTVWYNLSRAKTRRGSLWANRFKHTLLGDARAVWTCLRYVELNAVRAGMVKEPFDYRFCTGGYWAANMHHPFQRNFQKRVIPLLHGIIPTTSIDCCYAFINSQSAQDRIHVNPVDAAVVYADRRTRFWVNSLMIGSKVVIRDMMAYFREELEAKNGLNTIRECSPWDPYVRTAIELSP